MALEREALQLALRRLFARRRGALGTPALLVFRMARMRLFMLEWDSSHDGDIVICCWAGTVYATGKEPAGLPFHQAMLKQQGLLGERGCAIALPAAVCCPYSAQGARPRESGIFDSSNAACSCMQCGGPLCQQHAPRRPPNTRCHSDTDPVTWHPALCQLLVPTCR